LIASRLHSAEDKIEPLVGIILIQPYLEVGCLIVIGEIHCAPFNVKDAIGRAARDGRKDATTAGEVITAFAHYVGAIIAPERKDRVIKRPNIWRRRQAR
jgi:hypothetical protein